ncbi:ERD2-like protein [Planoprotostelium fungivorum]|uniref:ER lumen protein-retaining receptor n=1 Tax=Planoprotostelium fungivorum TaxID=1890364 RepID=A0A2P6NJX9_9EUKA|nr:ERD2-like protein [Planoprotostelium fungivorum]
MSLNPIRFFADVLHLASILILLLKLRAGKSCSGISLKTQELYAIVFICRYLDLPYNYDSPYLFLMKLFFLSTSIAIVYYMRGPLKFTYDAEQDSFRVIFLIAPCAVLALIFNMAFTPFEILWTFSIYLEAVAILPQLFLLQRTGEVSNINSHYIFCLGAYRTLYLLNWIWRYFSEDGRTQWIVWLAGIVQTAIYCDFFYYFIQSKYYNKKMELPK